MITADRVVIALGGNALSSSDGEHGDVAEQAAAVARALTPLVPLFASGAKIAITHGNGPQVGNLMLRSELTTSVLPPLPIDTCVADTLGGITYTIARELHTLLRKAGIARQIAGVVTMTRVASGSGSPKPIGTEFPAERRAELESRGWQLITLPSGAVRRVVPSPRPLELLEMEPIRVLYEAGAIVIAAGGGGIPVSVADNGRVSGVEAVVDKDAVSALLAADLGADTLLILTDVDAVKVGYGTPSERSLGKVDAHALRELLAAREFGIGSMRPKVEAILRFVESGGSRGVICRLDQAIQALAGSAGTEVRAQVGVS